MTTETEEEQEKILHIKIAELYLPEVYADYCSGKISGWQLVKIVKRKMQQ